MRALFSFRCHRLGNEAIPGVSGVPVAESLAPGQITFDYPSSHVMNLIALEHQCGFGAHIHNPLTPFPCAVIGGIKQGLMSSMYAPHLDRLRACQRDSANESGCKPSSGEADNA